MGAFLVRNRPIHPGPSPVTIRGRPPNTQSHPPSSSSDSKFPGVWVARGESGGSNGDALGPVCTSIPPDCPSPSIRQRIPKTKAADEGAVFGRSLLENMEDQRDSDVIGGLSCQWRPRRAGKERGEGERSGREQAKRPAKESWSAWLSWPGWRGIERDGVQPWQPSLSRLSASGLEVSDQGGRGTGVLYPSPPPPFGAQSSAPRQHDGPNSNVHSKMQHLKRTNERWLDGPAGCPSAPSAP